MHAAPAFELTMQAPAPTRKRVGRITLTVISRDEQRTRCERRGTFSCPTGTPIEKVRRKVADSFFGSLGGRVDVEFIDATGGRFVAVDDVG